MWTAISIGQHFHFFWFKRKAQKLMELYERQRKWAPLQSTQSQGSRYDWCLKRGTRIQRFIVSLQLNESIKRNNIKTSWKCSCGLIDKEKIYFCILDYSDFSWLVIAECRVFCLFICIWILPFFRLRFICSMYIRFAIKSPRFHLKIFSFECKITSHHTVERFNTDFSSFVEEFTQTPDNKTPRATNQKPNKKSLRMNNIFKKIRKKRRIGYSMFILSIEVFMKSSRVFRWNIHFKQKYNKTEDAKKNEINKINVEYLRLVFASKGTTTTKIRCSALFYAVIQQ